jgi:hypothetical protein
MTSSIDFLFGHVICIS